MASQPALLELCTRARARVRKHLPNAVLVFSAITVCGAQFLATRGYLSTLIVLYAILAWACFAVGLTLKAHLNTLRVSRRIGDKIRAFVYVPTPIGSLVESLNSQDVAKSDLKSIALMSAGLEESVGYYKKGDYEGISLLKILDDNPNLVATIYGPAKTLNLRSPHKRMSLVEIEAEPTEHINLVVTNKGQNFVWYEPYHKVIDGRQYFTHGAYLIEIDEAKKSDIQSEYDRFIKRKDQFATMTIGALSAHEDATRRVPAGALADPAKGVEMRTPQLNEQPNLGYTMFKVGGLIAILGIGSWVALLGLNHPPLALTVSIIAAVGANAAMLGVLGDRRRDESH